MADQKPTRWYMQVKGTVPIIYKRGAGQRFPVAVVEPLYGNNSGAERQARGRLMAAAPELLDALKKTKRIIANRGDYGFDDALRSLLREITPLIAQVEGKE